MQMNKYHQSGCERKRFWLNRETALAAASGPPQTPVPECSCGAILFGNIRACRNTKKLGVSDCRMSVCQVGQHV
jgi:hypothetical protein